MHELRGTSAKIRSINLQSTNPVKMANQTEDSSRRRIKIQTKVNGNRNPVTNNAGPSNPPTTVHNPEPYVVDHNNNIQIPGQRTVPQSVVPNDRKRSSDEGTRTGFMKRFRWTLGLALVLSVLPSLRGEPPGNQLQNWDRPSGMPKIAQLEVMCGAQHMEVHLNFDAPFHGLVASKGMYGQAGCVYVPPRTGRNSFVFNIYYDKCGTKPDNHGKFYENTVVVQYDEELIEAWDEAKRLRCEWFNDYEKTATKTSPMVISDLEIVELNFHGDNVDCWMEIQEGKGPWAPPLNGIVPLGSPLTMVVAVKDPTGEFDMRVKACEASDGQGGHVLPLSDADGCIIRPKLLGKFAKMKIDDGKATVLTYAYINAFKFPDMLNVHLRCTVEICRHGCPNHCSSQYQLPGHGGPKQSPSQNVQNFLEPAPLESQNIPTFGRPNALQEATPQPLRHEPLPVPVEHQGPPKSQGQDQFFQPPPQFQHQEPPSVSMSPPRPLPKQQNFQGRPGHGRPPPAQKHPRPGGPPQHMRQGHGHPLPHPGMLGRPQKYHPRKFPKNPQGPHRQGLPHGDESDDGTKLTFEGQGASDILEELNQTVLLKEGGGPEEAARPLAESNAQELKGAGQSENEDEPLNFSAFPKGPRQLNIRRRRRSVSANSDTIGIQGAFRVISQADVDFVFNSTMTRRSAAPVLKGIMNPEETVYGGVCLPRLGFGIVFFGLGLASLVAVLTASFFAFSHYRSTKGKSGCSGEVMAVTDGHQTGLPPHPVFPMVILRNIW